MEQSDSGGVGAKKGFLYQDYAAAYFLLKMLRDKSIISIRCEVTDDIDVVYQDYIEYVQVKTTDAERKWTLKEFTEPSYSYVEPTGRQRKKQKVSNNDSILHKSMNCDNDTGKRSKFRILSPRDVLKPLIFLKTPFHARPEKTGRSELLFQLKKKISDYKSPNLIKVFNSFHNRRFCRYRSASKIVTIGESSRKYNKVNFWKGRLFMPDHFDIEFRKHFKSSLTIFVTIRTRKNYDSALYYSETS